jgi:hypothetical protein
MEHIKLAGTIIGSNSTIERERERERVGGGGRKKDLSVKVNS